MGRSTCGARDVPVSHGTRNNNNDQVTLCKQRNYQRLGNSLVPSSHRVIE